MIDEPAPEQPNPPPRPSRLFRIVTAMDPPLDDFKSNAARGKPPRGPEITDPDEYWSLSTFARFDQAEDMARRHVPNWKLGRYVAELRIGPRSRVQAWRSNPHLEGHYSLKGRPRTIKRLVVGPAVKLL